MQKKTGTSTQMPDTNGAADHHPGQLILEFSQQYSRVMNAMMNTPLSADLAQFSLRIGSLFAKAALNSSTDFDRLSRMQLSAISKYAILGNYMLQKSLGHDASPAVKPGTDDARFKSSAWQADSVGSQDTPWPGDLWFDAMKQSYLIGTEFLREYFQPAGHLSDQEARQLKFYTEQVIDAMSPTNFPGTNPDVLQAIRRSNGRNLVQGLCNLADDLEAGQGMRMVDGDAFELGHNIATTPGQVIARNRMAELIQYASTTDMVYARPIMIIPPWINKYYILDLSPRNSFIGWLVDQGYTVFVISWVNPDESYRNTTFEDYLREGPLWAMQTIQSISGQNRINAIGYCLGGTLLATLLGYLARESDSAVEISSATFFASMIDFSEPGDLGVFVDEQSVSELEVKMQERGYLDGGSMASTFNMMRSNDLVWHFVINNYLLGKPPTQFDLLYWNSDSTRLPAAMHSFYFRKMYIENKLAEPDGITVLGHPIDLSKIQCPTAFISTEADHIAPWRSTYSGAKLLSGRVQFILGQSGHIAGIINPPTRTKYGYWSGSKGLPDTADEWLDSADYREGSWWPEWERWVKRRSGKKIPASAPGSAVYPPLADAPGTYVNL